MILVKAGKTPTTAFSQKPPFAGRGYLPFHALFLLQSLQVGYHWRIDYFFAGNRGWDSRQAGGMFENFGVAGSHSTAEFSSKKDYCNFFLKSGNNG